MPPTASPNPMKQTFEPAIKAIAGGVFALGLLVIAGWTFDIPALKSPAPGTVTMKPNAAVAFLCCGVSLWLAVGAQGRAARHRGSQTCAWMAVLIGAAVLSQDLLGRDWGIDQLLFMEAPGATGTSHPGRMAPNTAISFILLGFALAMADRGRLRTAAAAMFVSTATLSLLALIGYLYQAEMLNGFAAYTRMAVHTAVAFFALGVGGLMFIAEVCAAHGAGEATVSARLALRLLPAVIIVPLVLGWLRLQGELAGFYTAGFGVAVMVVSTIVILSLVVWRNSRSLARAEADRRRAEEAHLESEKRSRLIIDTAYDAFVAMDIDGRIIDWNPQAEKTFGYSREEAIGRSLAETIIPERFRVMHWRGLQRFRETGEGPVVNKRIEVHAVDRSGREFPAELTISPLRWGNTWYFNAFVHDISDRMERDALEAASAAKDHFIAVLSHELRTPLTPVLATIMDLDARLDLAPPVREAISLIQRNVELEARLIDDLLDVTRISKGKLRVERQPVSVHSVIRHAMEICQSLISRKRVDVKLELAAPNSNVAGDPPRLLQVFWNLLQNALKFTPTGGEIVVRTRGKDDRLEVQIADTGIGISAEALPRIFEPFEQGDATISRRFGGLGLGLALSKALVEAHGGKIEAESAGENRGTTMTMEFETIESLVEPGLPAGPAPAIREKRPPPLRLLLVEDHEDTRETLKRLLTRWGHSVEVSSTVRDALDLARRDSFDLLISDLGLPDASGLELLRQVREFSSMPAIAISGFGTEEDTARSIKAGFLAHLTKPIGAQRLRAMIDEFAVSRIQ